MVGEKPSYQLWTGIEAEGSINHGNYPQTAHPEWMIRIDSEKKDNEEIGNGALLQDMWENTIQ